VKMYLALAAASFLLIVVAASVRMFKRRKKKINPDYFMERWIALQKCCSTRKTWPDAIIEADALLDEALRRSGYRGRTTGERLVSAQRALTNNESVWFGHKLCKRIPEEDVRRLRKQDILEALHGFRQALRDLGALHVPEPAVQEAVQYD
jgi:hypothetical protein